MKLERLNQDKIRIFLTFDDLMERGINKEDIWQDIPKIHELFHDMMNQAYQELDFEVNGPVAVEVYSLPAQGMVVIVTRGRGAVDAVQDEEHEDMQDYYELEVTLDESDDILFVFNELDDCIQVAHKLAPFLEGDGTLYKYNDRYYLLFEDLVVEDEVYELLIALLSEFGEPSTQSKYVLNEYGTVIIKERAVETLCRYFKP
ncbi:genetic competence negative regulator [Caldalkalibacillus thermarum TA2.A1]|uniref:Adapter protein MecA n=1 Tax=Caldalkalibacillus thermarum (strain TA2.A1) TaxID=986075 RepID=A0A8X8I1R9_CALTT|nr:genetic competence negative regulator [Caldalkalibacillus thermarum]QZT32616.1 genetic competence negative regulator [Caldalkalibacillus thermarum TA2.A1]